MVPQLFLGPWPASSAVKVEREEDVVRYRQQMADELGGLEARQRVQWCYTIAICEWRLERDGNAASWLDRAFDEVAGNEDLFGEQLRNAAIVAYRVVGPDRALRIAGDLQDDVWRQVALRDLAQIAARDNRKKTMFGALGAMRRDYNWFEGIARAITELTESGDEKGIDELLKPLAAQAKKAARSGMTDLRDPLVALARTSRFDDVDRLLTYADDLDADYARRDIVGVLAGKDLKRARAYLDAIADHECRRHAEAEFKSAL
jgi:hypothetical protein